MRHDDALVFLGKQIGSPSIGFALQVIETIGQAGQMCSDVGIVKQQGQIGIVYGINDGLLLMRGGNATRRGSGRCGQGFVVAGCGVRFVHRARSCARLSGIVFNQADIVVLHHIDQGMHLPVLHGLDTVIRALERPHADRGRQNQQNHADGQGQTKL